MVIQGSVRPEAKSYSIVDPAIYSSISQRLEYPIFGAIHRELFNSFHFFFHFARFRVNRLCRGVSGKYF